MGINIQEKPIETTVEELSAEKIDFLNIQSLAYMREVERELNAPKQGQGTDLQKLLAQLQENPELAAQLKALLNAK